MKSSFKGYFAAALLAAAVPNLASAQTATVKLGQIEAQTGPNAIYGYMSSQGVPIAVDEVNKAGGFKVGDTTYKLELIALDTRGDPKEATIQLKKLLEQTRSSLSLGRFFPTFLSRSTPTPSSSTASS
jgi:branched-chain amino acid transport system substrate-binding protein